MDRIPAPVTDAVRVRKKKSKKGQLNSDLLDGWTGGNITRIVRSERYMGAVLIQKKFTPDYLTHEVRDNKGEVPQYLSGTIIRQSLMRTCLKRHRKS